MISTTDLTGESDRLDGTPHPRHAAMLEGHAQAEQDLLDAYRGKRLPHAIILGGPSGIGKATLAWRLARFILAYPDHASAAVQTARDLFVPASAKAAGQIAALAHPDVSLLRREINEQSKRFYTEIRANDVRRTIQMFQRAAGAGGYRICILDCAEDLNRSSANALLKLIEEPPPNSLFLIVSHRPGLILPTIRSRARLIWLQTLEPAGIAAVVKSLGPPWRDEPDGMIEKAAAQARGSVHGALRLLGAQGLDLDALVQRLLQRLPAVDWREVHRLADQTAGRGGETSFDIAITAIVDWISDQVRSGAGQGAARLAPYAEVWEKVAANTRETDALNLDKRPLLLTIFSDLAAAAEAASS